MKIAAELRKNVEQCCTEFADMLQTCIRDLTEYRTRRLERLQSEKEELLTAIETAIQETTNSLDQEVRTVGILCPEKLKELSDTMSVSDLQSLCPSWAHYQTSLEGLYERLVCIPLPPPEEESPLDQPSHVCQDLFAAVIYSDIELYDLTTQQITHRTLPDELNLGNEGSYIALDTHTLLCLGASPPSTAVYELHLCSLQLTPLPPLHTPRRAAGVAKTSHFVYVFGGLQVKSCEKYALRDKQWLPLRDMKYQRSSFTPCTFRSLIYLPCPRTTLIIESFSLETETFAELPVTLPAVMNMNRSVAFVSGGELCVLTHCGHLGWCKLDSDREFHLVSMDRSCWSTQPPLIVDSLVFIANNTIGKVMTFNMQDKRFV